MKVAALLLLAAIALASNRVIVGDPHSGAVPATAQNASDRLFSVMLRGEASAVPEPGTLILMGGALIAFGVWRRRPK